MKEINNIEEFNTIVEDEPAVLAYFSHDACNVCKILKPKLNGMTNESFPKMQQIYINTERSPEIAGKCNIFTVPVVIVYFAGKESFRKSRNFGIGEIQEAIERPYSIILAD